jgi:TolB-like protein
MKNLIRTLLLLSLGGCAPVELAVKKDFQLDRDIKVAVLNFEAPRLGEGMYGQIAADIVTQELLKFGFSVIERSQIEKTAGDSDKTKQALESLGVQRMVTGSVFPALQGGRLVAPPPTPSPRKKSKTEEKPQMSVIGIGLSLRMIDAKSGELLWVGSSQADGTTVEVAIRAATRRILKQLKQSFRRS